MNRKQTTLSVSVWVLLLLLLLPAAAPATEWQDYLDDTYGIIAAGFLEVRYGQRLQEDLNQKDAAVSEVRGQMGLEGEVGGVSLVFKGYLLGDAVEEDLLGEVRELNAGFSPLNWMDVKFGRQALTWGTGDLLFINDLFPKDWESFFIGRDDEYLKAPADALKVSTFSKWVNLDLVYLPRFNGSRYIDGDRLSYWNPQMAAIAGRNAVLTDEAPHRFFSDNEFHLRLTRRLGSYEMALYGYQGYWKTPEGVDPSAGKLIYPQLAVYGSSLRGPVWGGIGNLEAGYYDSRDDTSGDNSLVRNSETRMLAGFEREIIPDLTGGVQYYVEWMAHHDAYLQTADPVTARDAVRHLLTLRLTQLLMNQNLRLLFFAYYSPSDQDAYFRPKVRYKVTDSWTVEGGANLFAGAKDHTFFGQFERNDNVYAGVRFGF